MTKTILVVIPSFGRFEYVAEAVASALSATTLLDPHVILVDDASPEWVGPNLPPPVDAIWGRKLGARFAVHRFGRNGGLTRSWNYGLDRAGRGERFDYCCVTNSDVVFAPGWDRAIVAALDSGYDLVGPVTNAPGTNPDQYVAKYSRLYDRADPGANLCAVQGELSARTGAPVLATTLNGFCLVAKARTWWEHAYDDAHVFKPRNDVNSKGEPNPTPLMTLQEYELQARWKQKGLRIGAVLGSYVFHYRAVSRGDRHKRGDWVRKEGSA